MKTAFLMASPTAEGLIHRAATQSGPGLRFMEPDRAREATAKLFAALDLAEGDVGALQSIPAAKLLAGFHAVAALMRAKRFIDLPCFAPVLDPEVLPHHPFAPDAARLTRPIPMILGWNAQEMSFFMGNDPEGFELDENGLEARMADIFGDAAAAMLPLYHAAYPDASPSRLWIQAHSDYSVMLPMIAQAERRVEADSAGTWLHRFDFQSPALGGKLGAMHTMEGNLLFNQPGPGRAVLGDGPEVAELARKMSSAWVAFAQSGDPNGGGTELPIWPAYDLARRQTMIFEGECRVEDDPVPELRAALAAHLAA
jgi:para-nitrobenzyl esterase